MNLVIEEKWGKEVNSLIDKYTNSLTLSSGYEESSFGVILKYEQAIEFVNYLVRYQNVCIIDIELLSYDASNYDDVYYISLTKNLYTDEFYPDHENELELTVEKLYHEEYKSPLTGKSIPAGYLMYEAGILIVDEHVNVDILNYNCHKHPIIYFIDNSGCLTDISHYTHLRHINELYGVELYSDVSDVYTFLKNIKNISKYF